MSSLRMSDMVRSRVRTAAQRLGAADPEPYVGGLIDRSFDAPLGDDTYGANALTPGAVPFEPSFSETEPDTLRFTLQPLGPSAAPVSRRDEATREMRRLVGPVFGRDALRWFDERSEAWRGLANGSRLHYGAWFGTGLNGHGLTASKVYYELGAGQLEGLPPRLRRLAETVRDTVPALAPVFTSIACRHRGPSQRVSFVLRRPLRLAELEPLMQRLGMAHQLPGMMRVIGVALGGRFELPERGALIAIGDTPNGPELRVEVLLGAIPDVPESFLQLLALGLSERPRELQALGRWLQAFTPDDSATPGELSVLSVRANPMTNARVGLYLRPVDFELNDAFAGALPSVA